MISDIFRKGALDTDSQMRTSHLYFACKAVYLRSQIEGTISRNFITNRVTFIWGRQSQTLIWRFSNDTLQLQKLCLKLSSTLKFLYQLRYRRYEPINRENRIFFLYSYVRSVVQLHYDNPISSRYRVNLFKHPYDPRSNMTKDTSCCMMLKITYQVFVVNCFICFIVFIP